MATKYIRLFAMSKTKIWTGASKPDDPHPGPTNKELYDDTFDPETSINKDILRFNEIEPINTSSNPVNTDVTVGYEEWGLLVQEALYSDSDLRKVLRFYKISEIQGLYPGCDMKEINTFKDALSLKAVKKASIIIKTEREGTVYPLFGALHATTIIIGSCAVEAEVTEFFRTKTFKIGPDNILYKAVEGSVKIQSTQSKATALF